MNTKKRKKGRRTLKRVEHRVFYFFFCRAFYPNALRLLGTVPCSQGFEVPNSLCCSKFPARRSSFLDAGGCRLCHSRCPIKMTETKKRPKKEALSAYQLGIAPSRGVDRQLFRPISSSEALKQTMMMEGGF